jgi:hypothetical protein
MFDLTSLVGKTVSSVEARDITVSNNADDSIALNRVRIEFTDGSTVELDEFVGDYFEPDEG